MASIVDTSGLTLEPQEALNASEAVFEKVFVKNDLEDMHAVMTGIQMKTQIPFYGLIDLVGKASSACLSNEEAGVTSSQKYWDPALVDFRLIHCQGEVDQLFKMWKRSAIAKDTWEDVDSEMMAFIADRAIDATHESILRITSLGDTAALNVSGGGVITNGISTDYFTMIDGLWKQIFDAIAGIHRYTITENSAVSYALQDTLASDRAYLTMKDLYNNADSRLLAQMASGSVKYQMTRSLFNNWQDYLESASLAFTTERTEEGTTVWKYRGIPIVIRDDWDRNIRAYEDNGTTYNLPHRMILTDTSNIPIGTSDTESMNSFNSHYDATDKKHYIDVAYYIDVKWLEDYMGTVAY